MKKDELMYFTTYSDKPIVSIIHGENSNEIKINSINNRIFFDCLQKLYLIDTKHSIITTFNSDYLVKNKYKILNDGNIAVDLKEKKLYASNIDKVYVCNLENGDILEVIAGFTAITYMKFDQHKNQLLILDAFNKNLCLYDGTDLKLIHKYSNVGANPYYICISNEKLYIVSKGGLTKKYKSSILELDLISGKTSAIFFQNDINVGAAELGEKCLYILDRYRNGIKIIDLFNKKEVGIIKGTYKIKKIRHIEGKSTLLIFEENIEDELIIETVDTTNNNIVDIINFKNKKVFDIDIIVAETQDKHKEHLDNNAKFTHDYDLNELLIGIADSFGKIEAQKKRLEEEIKTLNEKLIKNRQEILNKDIEFGKYKKKFKYYKNYIESLEKKNRDLNNKLFEAYRADASSKQEAIERNDEKDLTKENIYESLMQALIKRLLH